ncbi:alpha-ketoglutarate-dependent dioxygenase AlkB [soil metagenome]
MTAAASQPDLFAAAPAPDLPEGFAWRPDVISPAQERALAGQFARLPLAPFEFHGFQGRRRVLSFGWRYDYGQRRLHPSLEMPPFLLALREIAAGVAALPAARLQQGLVTEYSPGSAIGWHLDKPMFEDVVALSFLSPALLRFRRRHEAGRAQGWDRRALEIPPRSAYLLRGPARREWQHSLPPVEALRYSVTFRSLVEGGQSG